MTPPVFMQRKNITLAGVFFIFTLFFPVPSPAQHYNFRNYNVENGLPASNTYTMLQDRKGAIWFGTNDGLSRFDGNTFTVYKKKDGLYENSVTASCEDAGGNIWFGHQEGGVTIYYPDSGIFRLFPLNDSLPKRFIYDITRDHSQNIWFCTIGGGLIRYDGKKLKSFDQTSGLVDNLVFSAAQDNEGRIWAATNNGVSVIENEKVYTVNGLPGKAYRCIMTDSKGNLWIATKDTGLVFIPRKALSGKSFPASVGSNFRLYTVKEGLSDNYTYHITEGNQGAIWIASYRTGISKFVCTDTITGKGYFKNFSSRNGLAYDVVWRIMADRENNLWAGTLGGGVSQLKYNDERFELFTTQEGLINSQVWAITQDRKGNYWYGTDGGVTCLSMDPVTKKINSAKSFSSKDGLPYNKVKSIYADESNTIWVGTDGSGVCFLPEGSSRFRSLKTGKGLAGPSVLSICDDNKGSLWFATYTGLSKLDKSTGEVTNQSKGLMNHVVRCVYKDLRKNIWIATEAGLSMFDGKKLVTYNHSNGLAHEKIYCITGDRDGNIWFGTEGGGIYMYDFRQFRNYAAKDGISSESVYSILCDKGNNIWAGTSSGVDRFDQKTSTFRHYGKEDGFLGVDNNLNAAYRDHEGSLWFGTINGVVKYDPRKDAANKVEPLTYISRLKVLLKEFPFPPSHQFSYKQNYITFQYIGISLSIPEKVRYQIRLEGFDRDWLPVTDRTEFTYSNLPPGDYIFMVKACNNEGVWNEHPAKYTFSITPPFWKTWWFYISCVILAFAAIYTFIKVRTKNLEHAKLMLETQVAERTAEVVKQKEEIEQKNEKLSYAYIEIEKNRDEIAEKNKDITDSIHYAKRIQDAILPMKQDMQAVIPDSFIFFRPRDVVSGDFYWFSVVSNTLVLASADCTGHGVPGAFMSMIGVTLLNQIVKDSGITTTAMALSELDKGIKAALKQSGEEEKEMHDGMDIALCAIDLEKKMMQYAGALRPLYLVRKGELMEFRADKFSIGGYYKGQKKFTNHSISLQKGDSVYLFSDGYVDQFGGPEGKKFMTKKLKEMLLKIQSFSMHEQEKIIIETIDRWKGSLEQIDDLLFMGLRVL